MGAWLRVGGGGWEGVVKCRRRRSGYRLNRAWLRAGGEAGRAWLSVGEGEVVIG